MASTDARPIPRRNQAFRLPLAFRDADRQLITGWTGADSEVSRDGGSYADCTNEAVEIGSTGSGYLDLTAAEMDADQVFVKVSISNAGAAPLLFSLCPAEDGDIRVDAVQWAGGAIPAPAETGVPTTRLAPTTHSGATIPTVTEVTEPLAPASSVAVDGLEFPHAPNLYDTHATVVMDAANEGVAFAFQAPKAGRLRYIKFYLNLQSTPNLTLRGGVQGFASGGLPDGTFTHHADLTPPFTAGQYLVFDLGAGAGPEVEADEWVQAVCVVQSRTSGSVTLSQRSTGAGTNPATAWTAQNTGSGWSSLGGFPTGRVGYDGDADDTPVEGVYPVGLTNQEQYASGSSSNEYGNRIVDEDGGLVAGVKFYGRVQDEVRVAVLDADLNVLAHVDYDPANKANPGANTNEWYFPFDAPLEVEPGAVLYATVRALAATSPTATLRYHQVPSAGDLDLLPGGQEFHGVHRAWSTGAEAFTTQTNRRYGLSLVKSQVGVGSGSGSGISLSDLQAELDEIKGDGWAESTDTLRAMKQQLDEIEGDTSVAATAASQATIITHLNEIKGDGFDSSNALANLTATVDTDALALALLASFPTNFTSLEIGVDGSVTVGKVGTQRVAPATRSGGDGETTLVLAADEVPGEAWVGRRMLFPASGQIGVVSAYDGDDTKQVTFAEAFDPPLSTGGGLVYLDFGPASAGGGLTLSDLAVQGQSYAEHQARLYALTGGKVLSRVDNGNGTFTITFGDYEDAPVYSTVFNPQTGQRSLVDLDPETP